MNARIEHRSFGPILELDGVTVSLTRDEYDGQMYVLVDTHGSCDRDPERDHKDGEPLIRIDLNDANVSKPHV